MWKRPYTSHLSNIHAGARKRYFTHTHAHNALNIHADTTTKNKVSQILCKYQCLLQVFLTSTLCRQCATTQSTTSYTQFHFMRSRLNWEHVACCDAGLWLAGEITSLHHHHRPAELTNFKNPDADAVSFNVIIKRTHLSSSFWRHLVSLLTHTCNSSRANVTSPEKWFSAAV